VELEHRNRRTTITRTGFIVLNETRKLLREAHKVAILPSP
jgi:hypothetical protein